MDASSPLTWLVSGDAAAAATAACLLTRVAATVQIAAPAILPEVGVRPRIALAVAVWLAALPAALSGPAAPADGWATLGLVLGAEWLVGAAGGFAIAALVGALAWGGEILGTASGLAWTDAEGPADSESTAGVAAVPRWVALAAFVAAGGIGGGLAAVVDGTRSLPPGGALGAASDGLLPLVVHASSTALGLAVALALPVLSAMAALHVAAAILLRVGECEAAAGLLPAATAVVMLAVLSAGAGVWTTAAGERLRPTVEAAVATAAGVPPAAAMPPRGER